MAITSIYGFQVDLSEDWKEQSVYTFVLKGGDTESFRANMTVVREKLDKPGLQGYVMSHKKLIQDNCPGLKLVREGQYAVASEDGYDAEYLFSAAQPIGTLTQWHVLFVRGDDGYSCCCTAEQRMFPSQKAKFEEILGSLSH